MDDQLFLAPPLFISSRLMAAVRVGDAGGTVHIEPRGRDHEDRAVCRYVIEDSDGAVLDDGTDVRSGVRDDFDARKMMGTLLGFLGAAAESYRYTMHGQTSENVDLFPPDVTEWAYQHDDELAALALELDDDQTTDALTMPTSCGERE
jgi:hypothetical protein